MKRKHPPILPGISGASIESIYDKWERTDQLVRQKIWKEYAIAMPYLMQHHAQEQEADWSLQMADNRRLERYSEVQARLKRYTIFYGALMSLPLIFVFEHGSQFMFWMNYLAMALLLAPAPLRLIITRAQIYHGGRVPLSALFKRYPKNLDLAHGSAAKTDQTDDLAGQFPNLCTLYGLESSQ